MLTEMRQNDRLQLILGLLLGGGFGFLLYKGGLTNYEVIIGQLLLKDFTMLKVVLTAVITGMLGNHLLAELGLVNLKPGGGSLWTAGVGGLIFGVGFGLLGYCPGTALGAAGRGAVDALFGVLGIMVGVWLFTVVYPLFTAMGLTEKKIDGVTVNQLLGIGRWSGIILVLIILTFILGSVEFIGF